MRRLAVLVALLLFPACGKANTQDCDKGCRNYFQLHYWEAAEIEIGAAPPEQREELRAKKAAELEPRMMKNLDLCIQKCQSGAETSRAKCWAAATTTREAKKCEN